MIYRSAMPARPKIIEKSNNVLISPGNLTNESTVWNTLWLACDQECKEYNGIVLFICLFLVV